MSVTKQLAVTPALTNRAIVALLSAEERRELLDPKDHRLQAALEYLARAMPEAWGIEQFRKG